jgi:general secretion pathway protein G
MRIRHFKFPSKYISFIFILALMGMMSFSGCSHPKRGIQTVGDRNGLLKTSLGMFEVDCGRYPTTSEGLQALFKKPADIPEKNWKGPYVEKESELKDQWGHEYIYRCPGVHNKNGYDLYSVGPDGKDGTTDDIGNWMTSGNQ